MVHEEMASLSTMISFKPLPTPSLEYPELSEPSIIQKNSGHIPAMW